VDINAEAVKQPENAATQEETAVLGDMISWGLYSWGLNAFALEYSQEYQDKTPEIFCKKCQKKTSLKDFVDWFVSAALKSIEDKKQSFLVWKNKMIELCDLFDIETPQGILDFMIAVSNEMNMKCSGCSGAEWEEVKTDNEKLTCC